MLYFFVESLGWFFIVVVLIVMIVLYVRLHQQFNKLRYNLTELQDELQQHKDSFRQFKSSQSTTSSKIAPPPLPTAVISNSDIATTITDIDNQAVIKTSDTEKFIDDVNTQSAQPLPTLSQRTPSKQAPSATVMEPDEHSLPIVTSLFNSLKQWFFGGNLVVRVGVTVLLVGVVLLLRLVSDYIEIPIELKLAVIAIIGLGLAGLGLKLATKRFAYGITLQGAGLAIAYLTTFFAYNVYQVIPNLPSFVILGLLSAVTVALAIRQNAFPLALLALSGGFFAPLLTATDTGSLMALFSYYLLLNVTIAVIAHYRTWKVLNVLGVAVTFGLAYYFGGFATLNADIEAQRWSLVVLVILHLALYLFVAIRYTQQIIDYNINHEASHLSSTSIAAPSDTKPVRSLYLYPLDIGLLFSVPVLAFGLFAALLQGIEHALTITSAILGAIYLALGWLFIRRSQRYALITEGMLALGFGFLALVVPLAFDAEWMAVGWSIQGVALVWFGRRSLRAWLVIFGLLLQLVSIGVLFLYAFFSDATTLAMSLSAIASLAAMFILRAYNAPRLSIITNPSANNPIDDVTQYAKSLGISTQAAQQWLMSINRETTAFNVVWRSPALISLLTFMAMAWTLYVLVSDFDLWLASWQLATTTLIALAALVSLAIYWLINRYRPWAEVSHFSHALLSIFYVALVLQLPQKFEYAYQWLTIDWLIFAILLIGWAIIGQLWLKSWYSNTSTNSADSFNHDDDSNNNVNSNSVNTHLAQFNYASWLATGILVLAAAAHYGLPDSDSVMMVLIPSVCLLALMNHAQRKSKNLLPWFDWHQALVGCSFIFIPLLLGWVVISNWYHDGVVWSLPYIPVLNLYDIAVLLAMAYGLKVYTLSQNNGALQSTAHAHQDKTIFKNLLLKAIGIICFWVLSSMLVRTLHAYAGTPLWTDGAWGDDKVQTGLTILWTLTALIATFMSSRNGKRFWWIMGIGLLGVVVIKLVLVDLSQTGAIWRVVSFLVAGSLILLIGYLAPLPPEQAVGVNSIKQ